MEGNSLYIIKKKKPEVLLLIELVVEREFLLACPNHKNYNYFWKEGRIIWKLARTNKLTNTHHEAGKVRHANLAKTHLHQDTPLDCPLFGQP